MRFKNDTRKLLGNILADLLLSPLNKFVPVKKEFENEFIVCFHHPNPNHKFHLIILPKQKIESLTDLKQEDLVYISEIYRCIPAIVNKFDLIKKGYSVIVNGGSKQEINQLHFHLISNNL